MANEYKNCSPQMREYLKARDAGMGNGIQMGYETGLDPAYRASEYREDAIEQTPHSPSSGEPIFYGDRGLRKDSIEMTDTQRADLQRKVTSNYTEAWKKGTKYDPNRRK